MRKQKSKIYELAGQAHRLRMLANLITTVTAEIVKTEKEVKLPRTGLDDQMRAVEEHFNEIADKLEEQGIEACGNDLDEWIDVCNEISDGEKADDEAEARAIRARARKRSSK